MAHEVFISYSHKDKAVADAICNHLENEGLRCWYAPRDIQPGEEWGNAIVKGIEAARIMVLVFTPDANLSQQVLREVNNAVSAGATIIPFRLTEEEPTGGMRYYLSSVHWLDAMNTELEDSINKLTDLCKAVIDGSYEDKAGAEEGTSDEALGEKAGAGKKKITIAVIAALILACAVGGFALFGGDKPESGSSGSEESSEGSLTTSTMEIGATSEGAIDEPDCTYTSGNVQGNSINGGYMAADSEYLYYSSNDAGRIYRMKKDGSDIKQISDNPGQFINIYNDYVYYVSPKHGTFRVKTDGTGQEQLREDYMWDMRIMNDRIYFTSEDKLCSTDLDGKDERVEWNDLGDEQILEWCMDFDYVYFIDHDRGGYLYRVNLQEDQTHEEVCIYDHELYQLTIAGKYLYFQDNDLFLAECSYDLTTGEVLKINDMPLNYPTVTVDGMFGYETENFKLAMLDTDSKEIKILSDDEVENVNVMGGKIFYKLRDDNEYYMTDMDGSNRIEL